MDPIIGTICAFGFDFAPQKWAVCDGQTLLIASNTALFSLIGTGYGGNGTTTFCLPDLRGRAIVGQGTGLARHYSMREIGGTNGVSLSVFHLPAHTHTFTVTENINTADANLTNPVGNYLAVSTGGSMYATVHTNQDTLAPAQCTIGIEGQNRPIDISQPMLVMNYCIAVHGIFPCRQN